MEIQVRVSNLTVTPSDTSGVILTAEVCDADAFIDAILKRADDGADSWPLAKRYGEVCDARREAERERDELRALLEKCEWADCSLWGASDHDEAINLCPVCGGASPEMVDEESAVAALPYGNRNYDDAAIARLRANRGHRPNCALAQALGRDGS